VPAELSPSLSDLFPPGAVAATLLGPGDAALLLPEEAACIAQAAPQRVREFAAGRQCAHRVLAELGIARVPLPVSPGREPLWPPGIVGSITHTEGMCAAVAARGLHLQALGIDVEAAGAVKEELFAAICTSAELEELRGCPAPTRAVRSALIFSAKEAFHKCQYSITRQWLGFEDVAIELDGLGTSLGEFTVRAQRPIALSEHRAAPWRGRFLFDDHYVVTGIGFARSAGATDQ
jgi:4'-phosphopantetheinyl transferase EntD